MQCNVDGMADGIATNSEKQDRGTNLRTSETGVADQRTLLPIRLAMCEK